MQNRRVFVVEKAARGHRYLYLAESVRDPGGRVAITVANAGGRASVAVTDTGVGIRSDDLTHVFERFYRGEPAASHETPGAGLGLALARWIADQHRAAIAVSSAPGAGSTFTVTFPAAPIAPASTAEPGSAASRAMSPGGRPLE